MRLETLNYHHLRLFWAVATEGNLTRAASNLYLTPQTVSAQIKDLEASLGEKLFQKVGRGLALTETGQLVLDYSNKIFSITQELLENLKGRPSGDILQLVVGIVDSLPKLVAHTLIEPALNLDTPVKILCKEGSSKELLEDLEKHKIDVLLSDSPAPENFKIPVYGHLLGSCGITFLASEKKAKELRKDFPKSLDKEATLLPTNSSLLRRDLNAWFNMLEIEPHVVGEFEDSALLKVFGQAGNGLFAAPSIIAAEVMRQYEVSSIGSTEEVKEMFYAISTERHVQHPAVLAMYKQARKTFMKSEDNL